MADSYPDNKYPGLMTGSVELRKDIDLNAIPPNGKRPSSPPFTQHLFGTFSD